jgi:hypothetical protein
MFSVAGGGKFEQGFLAAGLSDLGSSTDSEDFNPLDLVKHAALGGAGSLLGGGKFENGAATGAFGYLFNNLLDHSGFKAGTEFGFATGTAAAATCEVVTAGICTAGAPVIFGGIAISGMVAGEVGDTAQSAYDKLVHGNSADSMRGTEVYYLINRSSGAIDKIGITSSPSERYSDAYLRREDVEYLTQARYQWRYPAMVDENIRLTHYYIENGHLPRLNQGFH